MAGANVVWIDGVPYASKHRLVIEHYAKLKFKNDAQPVGGLGDTQRQCDPLPALEQGKKAQRGRKARVVICVKIISIRKREADLDNIVAGAKPLRDAIAKSLGVDDGHKRIRWEYDTVVTTGATGTQILISKL